MSKTKRWIVRVECIVNKEVICDNCTEDQARNNPFEFASNERELGVVGWNVDSVEPNELNPQ